MKKNYFLYFLLFISVLSFSKQQKSYYMWFDCEGNYSMLSHPDSIAITFERLQKSGITDVVIDVKSIMGETLFDSKFAPYMGEWKGVKRDNTYDLLGICIKEGHKYKMNVHASLNVFAGGHNFFDRGIIYSDTAKAKWQSIIYWYDGGKDGFRPISQMKWNYNGMLNPALKEVQEYELNILKECVQKYSELDGIILDRVRYDGISSDFSEASKQMFEKYASVKVEKFPQDILYWEKDNANNWQWKRGKHFNKWIEWRASVIYNFVKESREEIKKINPKIKFGDYTGSWYPSYYEVGVNWASKNYDPSKDYDWATPEYKNYAYSELLDFWMGGMYYYEVAVDERATEATIATRNEPGMKKTKETWYTVEGAAILSNKIIKGATPIYGSLYVQQYKDHPEQFIKAMKMVAEKTDGVMIFDFGYFPEYKWWNVLKESIK